MAEPKKELTPAQKAKKVADDRKKETLRLKQSKEREALHKSLKNHHNSKNVYINHRKLKEISINKQNPKMQKSLLWIP